MLVKVLYHFVLGLQIRIEGGEKEFGLIGNRVSVRTLKFNFGVGVLLGEGGGVVGTKREVAKEDNVGDDGCTTRER